MPQMSPLNWLIMYMLFLGLLFFSYLTLYYYMNINLGMHYYNKLSTNKNYLNKW